jgi:hypothetical protein
MAASGFAAVGGTAKQIRCNAVRLARFSHSTIKL